MDTEQRAFAAVNIPGELAYDRTAPGTPAGGYLRQFWMPVAEIGDVQPGRAKTITIMSEHFTLYRGESGEPHLIAHLCPHRHVALGTGRVEGEALRCFYHGWKFAGDGTCVEQPAEDVAFAGKVRAPAYPAREYLGLVFAYLGTGEPPPFPRFGRFERPGLELSRSYVRRTNFFNSLENSADHVHASFVHARSDFTTLGVLREITETEAVETEFGISMTSKYEEGPEGVHYIAMPLAAYIMVAEPGFDKLIDHLAFRIPIDDESHRTFIINYIEVFGEDRERVIAQRREQGAKLKTLPSHDDVVQAVIRGEIHIDDVPDRPDLVGIQDSVVMETQPPVSAREPDRLGRSDRAVILLRRIYAREIEAYMEGKPLKQWAFPEHLSAVSSV